MFTAKAKCLVNVSFVFDSVLSMVQSQSCCFKSHILSGSVTDFLSHVSLSLI